MDPVVCDLWFFFFFFFGGMIIGCSARLPLNKPLFIFKCPNFTLTLIYHLEYPVWLIWGP